MTTANPLHLAPEFGGYEFTGIAVIRRDMV